MVSETEICILIPNYNGLIYLSDCLDSLVNQKHNNFKIVLIDDGSIDGSVGYVSDNFSQVEILKLESNLGFARAVNLGIKHVLDHYDPKYLAVLNNDTKVDVAWLESLIKTAESDDNIAAVSSNMLYFDRPDIINSQGGTCDLIGYAHDINDGKNISEGYGDVRPILSACWGATLVRVSALEDVGLLDERYFSFAEDVDWGWRANLLGYKIVSDPKAIVLHHGSASWRGQDIRRHELCFRNMFCTMIKNYSAFYLLLLLIVILLHYPLVSIGYLLNLKFENGRLIRVFQYKNNFLDRIRSSLIPWKSLGWNVKELGTTIKYRRGIQQRRKVRDKEIFKLMIS